MTSPIALQLLTRNKDRILAGMGFAWRSGYFWGADRILGHLYDLRGTGIFGGNGDWEWSDCYAQHGL
jgi:hypothetical protein